MEDVITRQFKLFRAENQEERRIGFTQDALARIAVLHKAWRSIRESIDALEIKEPYPAMPRSRREGLWTNEAVFDEASGRTYRVDVKIDDEVYVHVHDLATKVLGGNLSVIVASHDFDEVRVTIHQNHSLKDGELIIAGDRCFENLRKSFLESPVPVPVDWIGTPFESHIHKKVIRRVLPTIETLPK